MSLTGDARGEPAKIGVAMADILTGVYAATTILAALRQRDKTGEGAHIDMALLDCQTAVLANQAMNYLVTGHVPARMGHAHPNIVPYQAFPTADGHIIIAVGNDTQFARLCTVLDADDLAQNPDYRTNEGRVRHRLHVIGRISELTSRKTRAELLAGLEAQGIPAGPINNLADVFGDPQIIARGIQGTLECCDTAIPTISGPFVMNGERLIAERASPCLGADGEAILKELKQNSTGD